MPQASHSPDPPSEAGVPLPGPKVGSSLSGVQGTLTFLFSDIEGSTRLEQAIGTRTYGELRERHRALLRAAITACGG